MLLTQLPLKLVLATPAAGWQPGMESGSSALWTSSGLGSRNAVRATVSRRPVHPTQNPQACARANSLAAHDQALSAAPACCAHIVRWFQPPESVWRMNCSSAFDVGIQVHQTLLRDLEVPCVA